jgi:hypothetical protein
MNTSPLNALYDRWTRPSYERRVRGPAPPLSTPLPPLPLTFLWGSAGILKDIIFDKPPTLHIRNDLFGDAVTFGTVIAPAVPGTLGAKTETGILQPGECVSIPLQGITGVYATCPTESVVACLIRD